MAEGAGDETSLLHPHGRAPRPLCSPSLGRTRGTGWLQGAASCWHPTERLPSINSELEINSNFWPWPRVRPTVPGLLRTAAAPASIPGVATPVFTAMASLVLPNEAPALQQVHDCLRPQPQIPSVHRRSFNKKMVTQRAAGCCSQSGSRALRKPGDDRAP